MFGRNIDFFAVCFSPSRCSGCRGAVLAFSRSAGSIRVENAIQVRRLPTSRHVSTLTSIFQ